MFTFIKNAFTNKSIRRSLLFTFFILAIFRLGSHVPVPGVNAQALRTISNSGILGLLNTFGGGALQRFSIFAMGVSPYITASIIVQLLQMDLIPTFTEWANQGEVGRRKLNQATTYLAIIIGFIQSYGMAFSFNQLAGLGLVNNPGLQTYSIIALILTAGTMFLVWLGEQITRNGVGNGLSMIIFAGIVAQVPQDVYRYVKSSLLNASGDQFNRNLMFFAGIVLAVVIGIIIVVIMEQAQRRIPIHYSKKVSGSRYVAHLPLKINSAGVIPVIFATSFMTLPQTIFAFMDTSNPGPIMKFFMEVFNLQSPVGVAFYTVLLIAFTYFYSLIQVNPEKVAENLQKQSGYIPSVRPGNDTEVFLTKTINRLSFVGALYLTLIAIIPILAGMIWKVPTSMALSGTSLLIVVGVGIETAKQIEGQMLRRRYKGFLYL
ncbi:preprotein translocase subunit SecY [Hutsoniella sourekii]